MRLIDADELKEHVGREALDTREKIFALVDRMPTIEHKPHGKKKCPICGSDLYEYCFMCCYEGEEVREI